MLSIRYRSKLDRGHAVSLRSILSDGAWDQNSQSAASPAKYSKHFSRCSIRALSVDGVTSTGVGISRPPFGWSFAASAQGGRRGRSAKSATSLA